MLLVFKTRHIAYAFAPYFIGDKMDNFSFLSAAEVDAMDILRKKIKRIELPVKSQVRQNSLFL